MHASLHAFSTLVLDCDGVLLQSNQIKTAAFARLFAAYPDRVPEILAYHRRHGGVSRYVKLAHIHHVILGTPLTETGLQALGEAFGALVREELMRCAEGAGARQFLAEARARGQHLYVASGTPEEELRQVLRSRTLAGYFEAIHGSPRSKAEIVQSILGDRGTPADEAVMIGDAISDQEAAEAAGIAFIAVHSDLGGPVPTSSRGLPAVQSLSELL